ncbi:MAG: DNA repair protein [Desulfobacteraceae bacterium IS3]|nr:MAG: DNA repair protein [Desulfobacteraceae bacterium IS3]
MKKAVLLLDNVCLKPSQIHKLRGFVGNLFRDYDVIHNHDVRTGKPIYRYPLIQFKMLDKTPAIIAVSDEAVKDFSKIFMELNKIVIDETEIPVYEKNLRCEDADFGYSEEQIVYEFLSPWIALNQENYRRYMGLSDKAEKSFMLRKALVGNLLSMSKSLGYWLGKEQEIIADAAVKEENVILKGKPMLGFTGAFISNFIIPDYLGIGKSVSRGFGTVRRIIY